MALPVKGLPHPLLWIARGQAQTGPYSLTQTFCGSVKKRMLL